MAPLCKHECTARCTQCVHALEIVCLPAQASAPKLGHFWSSLRCADNRINLAREDGGTSKQRSTALAFHDLPCYLACHVNLLLPRDCFQPCNFIWDAVQRTQAHRLQKRSGQRVWSLTKPSSACVGSSSPTVDRLPRREGAHVSDKLKEPSSAKLRDGSAKSRGTGARGRRRCIQVVTGKQTEAALNDGSSPATKMPRPSSLSCML